ncbi:hypothetical protein KL920_004982 [Ogataea angusta]|nr:hypothetical protein KL920_004982 [Ogataea angusta]
MLSDHGGVERRDDAAGRRKRAPDAVRGVHRQHAGSLYYAGAVPDVLQRSVGIRQPGKRLIDYAGVQRRDAADRVQRVCADVCRTGGAEPVPETDQVVSHHVPVQQGGLVYAAAGDVFVVFNGVLPARVHGREPRVDHSGVHSGRDAVRRGENGRTGGVAGVGTVRRQERVSGTATGAAGAVPERAGAVCGLPDPVHEDVDPCRGQKQGCWE